MLPPARVRWQEESHRRALLAGVDLDRAAECPRALLEHLERSPPSLTGSVVADRRLDPRIRSCDRDRELGRRAAPDRAVEGLADDLVERRLRALAERLGGLDVHLDPDAVREPALLAERLHRRAEALVAEDDRLEVEREVAELAD